MASIKAQDLPKIGSAMKTKQRFTKDKFYAPIVEATLLYLHTEHNIMKWFLLSVRTAWNPLKVLHPAEIRRSCGVLLSSVICVHLELNKNISAQDKLKSQMCLLNHEISINHIFLKRW